MHQSLLQSEEASGDALCIYGCVAFTKWGFHFLSLELNNKGLLMVFNYVYVNLGGYFLCRGHKHNWFNL